MVRAGEHAVTSDIDGRFRLPYVDGAAMLTVDFLGYESFVVQLRRGYDYNVVLQESSTALEEVCVVAYGTTRKAALTGAAAVSNCVKVRGVGRIAEEETADAAEPMIVVDGVLYEGALSDLAADDIVSISMLSDESAERLYGSRAAGGVVVVETRSSSSAADMPEGWREGGSLRADFRDDAFWQPSLTTDADGRVRFEVTYPDDITAWNADFVAVGKRRATAHRRLSVRSFMPLSARLSMPRFALVGDTLTAFGRMTNHTGDTVAVERTIDAGDISSERIVLDKSSVDRIPLAAASGDSISVVYRLSTEDGITDGERRSIPILPRGTLVTRGRFEIIADTLVRRFESSAEWGDVTIYADASGIECLSTQIGRLTDYPYDCNEQLASKLLAHLAHERICKARGIRFDGGHDVRRIIDRLVDDKRRDADGLWGWWSGSAGEMWITQHVVDALAQAESAGYKVRWSRRQLADAMIGRLDRIVVGRDGAGRGVDFVQTAHDSRRATPRRQCRLPTLRRSRFERARYHRGRVAARAERRPRLRPASVGRCRLDPFARPAHDDRHAALGRLSSVVAAKMPCRRRCRGYADGILPAARFWRQQGRYGRRARLSALSLRRRGAPEHLSGLARCRDASRRDARRRQYRFGGFGRDRRPPLRRVSRKACA